MAWAATDNFDSYSDGDLTGSNGGTSWSAAWSGAVDYDVQGTTVFQGAKAIKHGSTNEVNITRTLTEVTTGIVHVAMRTAQNTNMTPQFRLFKGATLVIYINFGQTGAKITVPDGASDVDSGLTYSIDTWHEFDIDFDASTDTYIFRKDGGSWSSTYGFRNAVTGIDTVDLNVNKSSASNSGIFWDDIKNGAAPATLTISVSDQLNVTESVTLLVTSFVSVSDQLNITESVTFLVTSFVSVSDQLNITESVTNTGQLGGISVSDQLNITESVTVVVVSNISVSDQLNITESVTNTGQLGGISVSDQLNITESVTNTGQLGGISVSDQLNITESAAPSLVAELSVSDQINITESASLTQFYNISVSDQLNITESVTNTGQLGGISVSDQLNITESVTNTGQLGISVSDQLNITESVTNSGQLGGISVSDQLNITESISPDVTSFKSVSDQLNITENLSFDSIRYSPGAIPLGQRGLGGTFGITF